MNRKARLPLPVPFYYGWVVLSLSFLTTLNSSGVRSALAVLIRPLEAEFGWSRAAISSTAAVNLFLFGVAAPIGGWFLDRFGPRRVMLAALTLVGIGVAGTTLVREFWQLILLWGVVVGMGAGAISSVLSATVAHRWFVARRGLALGILNSASSTGQLVFIPLLMAAIVTAGWRMGILLPVAVAGLLMVAIWLWMRDDPSDLGLEPYGVDAPAGAPGGEKAPLRGGPKTAGPSPILGAVKTPTFWLLCAIYFVCGGTANGLIGTHLIPYALDRGFPHVTAAATVGVMGGMNFVGTLFSGWLTDRVDSRKLLAAVFALRGAALFILPYVTSFSGLFVFAVIYGLDWFATVPPVVTITGDTFGKQAIGRIYGWIFMSHQIGAAVSAIGAGTIFAYSGDYEPAFLTGGVMGLIAAGLALTIKPLRPAAPMEPEPTALVRA